MRKPWLIGIAAFTLIGCGGGGGNAPPGGSCTRPSDCSGHLCALAPDGGSATCAQPCVLDGGSCPAGTQCQLVNVLCCDQSPCTLYCAEQSACF